jgi:hypothetical protein
MIKQLMVDRDTDHDVAVDAIATTVASMNVSHSEVSEKDFVWYSR